MNKVSQALIEIPRKNFLPDDVASEAEFDQPLPIGYNQTNSQPTTVRMMLEWLDPLPGNKVLDVGSGSGWTTALLAWLVGPKGRVYAVEKVPELVKFGRGNCRRVGIRNVKFYEAGITYGLSKCAPYDRILVSAAANSIPRDLIGQLAPGGKMVLPVQNSVFVVTKDKKGDIKEQEHYGFAFVPLV